MNGYLYLLGAYFYWLQEGQNKLKLGEPFNTLFTGYIYVYIQQKTYFTT